MKPSTTPAASEIIVGGHAVPLRVAGERTPIVLTWRDHGISFAPGQGWNKRRKQQIDLVVWHWTGGEGEPPAVAKVLKNRGYGVEFAIARTGVIYQFCDPLLVDTADAGSVNARSVGVEIVSYGMRSRTPGWKPPRAGAGRPVRKVAIHGVRCEVAAFHPEQLAAARALADGLSRGLGIPRKVPTTREGVVTSKLLSPGELAQFKGHIGHYHCSRQKCDPGPEFMAELNRFFAS